MRAVRLEFWLPPGSSERKCTVRLDSWRGECTILPDQVSYIDVPVSTPCAGVIVRVAIDGHRATPPDIRVLGAVLAGIKRI